jgi:hypothetical protein
MCVSSGLINEGSTTPSFLHSAVAYASWKRGANVFNRAVSISGVENGSNVSAKRVRFHSAMLGCSPNA